MVKGLYTAYTGMLNQQHMLDTITNNLANSATTGYKKEGATARAFDDMFIIKVKDGSEDYIDKRIGKASLGVKIGENYTDYTQGNLKITDNPYDLAITGDGFFEISYVNNHLSIREMVLLLSQTKGIWLQRMETLCRDAMETYRFPPK